MPVGRSAVGTGTGLWTFAVVRWWARPQACRRGRGIPEAGCVPPYERPASVNLSPGAGLVRDRPERSLIDRFLAPE